MSFNEKLQNLRKENKYSQEELADKLDVTRQSVSKWESGQTYPEMDKLLSLCKIFNCSLEELTNDDIKEFKKEKKNYLSSLVDSGLDIINKTYNFFTTISFREFVKCGFIMLIVVLILVLLRSPFVSLESGIYNTITSLSHKAFAMFTYNFFKVLIDAVYYIGAVLLFFYIFKIGFLDKTEIKEEVFSSSNEEKTEEKNEKKVNETKTFKRVQKDRDYTFFNTLGSIIMFFIKCLLFCFIVPFIFSFIGLFFCLVLDIYVLFKGLFYASAFFGILFCILLNGLLIVFAFNIIFNRKHNIKLLVILFLVGIAGIGVSGGLFALDLNNLTIVDSVPKNMKVETSSYTYDFNKALYLSTYNDIEYVVDNTLKNEVKIDANYYSDYNHVLVDNNDNIITFYDNNTRSIRFKNMTNQVIDDLQKDTIYNYNDLMDVKVIVTSSEENIKVIQKNIEDKNKVDEDYTNYVDELEKELDKLQDEYYKLQDDNDSLKEENDELKDKIAEYKDRVSSLLE